MAKATATDVDFVMHSRPFLLTVFWVENYRFRTKMETITKHIPRADARWLGQRLSRLTDDQIRDGFRAAGYGAGDVEGLDEDGLGAHRGARGPVIIGTPRHAGRPTPGEVQP